MQAMTVAEVLRHIKEAASTRPSEMVVRDVCTAGGLHNAVVEVNDRVIRVSRRAYNPDASWRWLDYCYAAQKAGKPIPYGPVQFLRLQILGHEVSVMERLYDQLDFGGPTFTVSDCRPDGACETLYCGEEPTHWPEWDDGTLAEQFREALGYTSEQQWLPLDLHSGNIMRRADGSYVITDPFA